MGTTSAKPQGSKEHEVGLHIPQNEIELLRKNFTTMKAKEPSSSKDLQAGKPTLTAKGVEAFFSQTPGLGHKLFEFMRTHSSSGAVDFEVFATCSELLIKELSHYHSPDFQSRRFEKIELFVLILLGRYKLPEDSEEYSNIIVGVKDMKTILENLLVLMDISGLKGSSSGPDMVTSMMNLVFEDNKTPRETTLERFFTKTKRELPYVNLAVRKFFTEKLLSNDLPKLPKIQKPSGIIPGEAFTLLSMSNIHIQNASNLQLLYSTAASGSSFNRIAYALRGYKAPTLLLISHGEKKQDGFERAVFGAFTTQEWYDDLSYQGNQDTYIFSLYPRFKNFVSYRGAGESNYSYMNTRRLERSKFKAGIGFGGSNFDKYRIWLDDDLEEESYVYPDDGTYERGFLASPSTMKIKIESIEIWGLGNEETLKLQEQYRIDEQEEIERRRKVDKKAFLSGFDKGLMFEKTFAGTQGAQEDIDHLREEASGKGKQ